MSSGHITVAATRAIEGGVDHVHRRLALLAELGVTDHTLIDHRIHSALAGADPWVLIGGPPCQAYSLAGRSRNRGIEGYSFENDHRATLYREYLRIIAGFWPTAFVMENVRGLLSAKLSGESVFERICGDLRDPAAALGRKSPHTYTLHALAPERLFPGNIAGDFLIRCERHGFPQARHRVIIVGLRNDTDPSRLGRLDAVPSVTVREAIGDLPILRSGLSKEADSSEAWLDAVLEICSQPYLRMFDTDIQMGLARIPHVQASMSKLRRGDEFIPTDRQPRWMSDWFHDPRLTGVVNHCTRSHIRSDLHR